MERRKEEKKSVLTGSLTVNVVVTWRWQRL